MAEIVSSLADMLGEPPAPGPPLLDGELQLWEDRASPSAPMQPFVLAEDMDGLPPGEYGDYENVIQGPEIELPYNWTPRSDQEPLWRYLMGGGLRAAVTAHRRWGKDEVGLRWTSCASQMRIGNYWHMLPQANQARKAIWNAVNPHTGLRRIDEAFPQEIRSGTREDEMMIKFRNGSTWQVLGSDNFDALVGSPPVGLVFSEWALADPLAWGMLRPILLENGGWALFIGTPRGHNHAEKTHKLAQKSDDWFGELLTVEDTDVFTPEQLRMEREELIAEHGEELGQAIFEQEYYCSFNAATPGAYFTLEMRKMRMEGRILDGLEPLPGLPVHTYWDIGVRDRTAILFVQKDGPRELVLDYYESSNRGVDHYAKELEDRRKLYGWTYGTHVGPHDLEERVWGTVGARKVIDLARDVGIIFRVAPKLKKLDSIGHVRQYLARVWVNAERCSRLISAWEQYHAVYDQGKDLQSAEPDHDWTCHPCFSYSTPVLMADGTSKPIGEITEGEQVWLPYGLSGEVAAAGQTGVRDTIVLEFDDGSEIECTPDHPFMSMSGLVPAIELAHNDPVFSQETEICQIDQKALERYGLRESLDLSLRGSRTGYGRKPPLRVVGKHRGTKNQLVYDLTVDRHHCFFANGVLVSNCDATKYGAQSPAWFFTQSWEELQTGGWGDEIEYPEAGVI